MFEIDIEREKVREAALKMLKNRDKSRKEIKTQLERLKFQSGMIEEILGSLEDSGLLDDSRYCEHMIEESIRKRKGRRSIKSELMSKGIERALIDEKLEILYSRDQEMENARIEAEKQLRDGIDKKSLDKTTRRLAYLGFESELIYDLLETMQYSDFYKQHLTS
jgi:regulatory protein